ncbi:MAG: hypothetical protein MJ252_11435 [archaeon]|nr:hypothetical protein [archaeon]
MEWNMFNGLSNCFDYQSDKKEEKEDDNKIDIENFIVSKSSDLEEESESQEYISNVFNQNALYNINNQVESQFNNNVQFPMKYEDNFPSANNFENQGMENQNYDMNFRYDFGFNANKNREMPLPNYGFNKPFPEFRENNFNFANQFIMNPNYINSPIYNHPVIENKNIHFEVAREEQNKIPKTLSERMKIKKEKVKKNLLEKKTQRSNFTENSKREESKIEGPIDEEKEKEIIAQILKTKKEIKMVRNRISAQRSRDRKKKEFDDLQALAKSLMEENKKLKKENLAKDLLIGKYKKVFDILFDNNENGKEESKEVKDKKEIENLDLDALAKLEKVEGKLTQSQLKNSLIISQKKLSLIAGIFAFICIIGTLVVSQPKVDLNSNKTGTNGIPGRLLGEEHMQIIKNDLMVKESITAPNSNSTKSDDSSLKDDNPKEEIKLKEIEKIKGKTEEKNSIMIYTEKEKIPKKKGETEAKEVPYNFVSARMESQELLAKLFREMNEMKEEEKNLRRERKKQKESKESKEDYSLQVFFPNESSILKTDTQNKKTEEDGNKTDFYEVKCKIFEVNKVYKNKTK